MKNNGFFLINSLLSVKTHIINGENRSDVDQLLTNILVHSGKIGKQIKIIEGDDDNEACKKVLEEIEILLYNLVELVHYVNYVCKNKSDNRS